MNDRPTLITGAAGFIGSNLTDKLLAQGTPVVGLDNFCDFYDPAIKRANLTLAANNPNFTLVEADVRDRDVIIQTFATHQPETVIHLAAMAGVRPSIERPAYYTQVNINGTTNVLDAAVANDVKRLIFASSSSVYGNNDKTPFAESDRVDHPISPYAATKKACELLCHSYSHLNKLPIFCPRFFTVFGPRQRPDLAISKFLKIISGGETLPMFGDGSTSRDYTFVDDITQGICRAIELCGSSPEHQFDIINLGGNKPVTLRELIETIEAVVGKKAIIKQLPMQPGDVDRTWADLTHANQVLGYAPKTSLQDGIAKQWASMK